MDYRKTFYVDAATKLKLKDRDPAYAAGCGSKQEAAEAAEEYRRKLAHLQALMYAEKKHSLLIILQGTDAAGKDGVVGRVFAAFNPQGVIVTSFKEPTPEELAHDFLWRVHPHAPREGIGRRSSTALITKMCLYLGPMKPSIKRPSPSAARIFAISKACSSTMER